MILLSVAGTGLAETAQHDIVYLCTNADGSKSFNGLPCGPNAKRSEYKISAPPKPIKATPSLRSGEILNETGQQQASALNKGTKLNPQPKKLADKEEILKKP